eukprot:Opistho-2@29355
MDAKKSSTMHAFEFTVASVDDAEGDGLSVPVTSPTAFSATSAASATSLPPSLCGRGIGPLPVTNSVSGRLSASSLIGSSPESLVKPCALIGFFAVVGLPNSAADLEPCESPAGAEEVPPLLAAYEARELQRFPAPTGSEEDIVDGSSVCQFCFPAGMRFRRGGRDGGSLGPASHSFIMTQHNGDRLYGSCLIFYEPIDNDDILGALGMLEDMYAITHPEAPLHPSQSVKKGPIYAPKCICIMSRHSFFGAFDAYLRQLHTNAVRSPTVKLAKHLPQPEACIRNLLFEVPTPRRGNGVRFYCPTPTAAPVALDVGRPSMRDLPHLDHQFIDLFDLLDLDNVLILFRCLLAERRIVLLTTRPERLVPTAECLLAMMYPFCWCYVYAPVLPRSLLHVLDSPVPYVVGICTDEPPRPTAPPANPHLRRLERQGSKSLLPQSSTNSSSNSPTPPTRDGRHRGSIFEDGSYHESNAASVTMAGGETFQFPPDAVLVDLDRNNIRVSESIPRLPGPEFRLLVEQLSDCIVKARTHPRNFDTDWPNRAFRAAFLRFFLNVFRGYAAYVASGQSRDSSGLFIPVSGDEDDDSAHPSPASVRWAPPEPLKNRRMSGAISPLPSRKRTDSPIPSEDTGDGFINGAFDSLAFMCDQPEANRTFLASFLATQTFANFIGEKTHALEGEPQQAVQYFDAVVAGRIQFSTDGLTGSTVFDNHNTYVCPVPAPPPASDPAEGGDRMASAGDDSDSDDSQSSFGDDDFPTWPMLMVEEIRAVPDTGILRDSDAAIQKFLSVESSPGIAQQLRWNSWNNIAQESAQKAAIPHDSLGLGITHAATRESLLASLASIARGLVACNGDPLSSSHGSQSSALSLSRTTSVVAADTDISVASDPVAAFPMQSDVLVARMCLVLERIWSHGLKGSTVTAAASDFWQFLNSVPDPMEQLSREDEMNPRRLRAVCAKEDVWVISRHTALKTDLGRGRAWVRLALEKRRLSDHLGAIVEGNTALLEQYYGEQAFLRSRDMIEAMLQQLAIIDQLGLSLFSDNYAADPDFDSELSMM